LTLPFSAKKLNEEIFFLLDKIQQVDIMVQNQNNKLIGISDAGTNNSTRAQFERNGAVGAGDSRPTFAP
jgi:hypothetical protein